MATARPTSENAVPGSPMSILLVGHSLVDFLDSGCSTMQKLWSKFSDILVKSPDVVYAEICSNDIVGGRDPISLADDVFQFANCLLAHGVKTVVLG